MMILRRYSNPIVRLTKTMMGATLGLVGPTEQTNEITATSEPTI
jgi:hypothetical protein